MYFERFPKITYDFKNNGSPGVQVVTDIFFRVNILNSIKNNVFVYFDYLVRDGDRLDILAERFYGNPEYHWIIAMANDMIDPIHDMPKDYNTFNKYIINKYGSIPTSQTTIHHYEKRILRQNNVDQISDIVTLEITEDTYNDTAETAYTTYNLPGGKSCFETITRHAISCYDWEVEQNDKRRAIKIIQAQYIPQILNEFKDLSISALGLPRGYRTIA